MLLYERADHLREHGLVESAGGRVSILDRGALERFATFTPNHLYGSGPLRIMHELDAVAA